MNLRVSRFCAGNPPAQSGSLVVRSRIRRPQAVSRLGVRETYSPPQHWQATGLPVSPTTSEPVTQTLSDIPKRINAASLSPGPALVGVRAASAVVNTGLE